MSGTLYVVATPIGNLEDITLRALRILREVALIAAEDTRRTAKLLTHYNIPTRTVSFHEHNTRRRVPELIERLRAEASVALVSDAGTPVLADPGLELIRACVAADILIDPIPGASAPLAALVASGFPAEPLTILGFSPSRSKDRIAWMANVVSLEHTVIFFETPHRIQATLETAASIWGDRPLVVGRELTKSHQQFLRGTATELVNCQIVLKGEFTVVVGPLQQPAPRERVNVDTNRILDEFRHLTKVALVTRRQAISELSRRYGRPSREIYATLEHAKKVVP